MLAIFSSAELILPDSGSNWFWGSNVPARCSGTRKQDRASSDERRCSDGHEQAGSAGSMLLQQARDERAQNASGTSDSEHHAYGGAAHFRIIGCRGEIIQNILPTQNAETGSAYADYIQGVNIKQN